MQRRQRQVDLHEFKARLVYRANSRTTSAIQRNPVLKNQEKQNSGERNREQIGTYSLYIQKCVYYYRAIIHKMYVIWMSHDIQIYMYMQKITEPEDLCFPRTHADSQNPYDVPQLSRTPVPGDLTPSSVLLQTQARKWYTDTHLSKTLVHIKQEQNQTQNNQTNYIHLAICLCILAQISLQILADLFKNIFFLFCFVCSLPTVWLWPSCMQFLQPPNEGIRSSVTDDCWTLYESSERTAHTPNL